MDPDSDILYKQARLEVKAAEAYNEEAESYARLYDASRRRNASEEVLETIEMKMVNSENLAQMHANRGKQILDQRDEVIRSAHEYMRVRFSD